MTDTRFFSLTALALALAGFLAYANTLDGEWVWDDASSVLLHEHVREPGKIFQLFREDQHAFGKGAGNFYRPLVSVSFMLDYALSFDAREDTDPTLPYPDVKPLVFHLTNIFWHVFAAVALLWLLLRLDAPRWVAAAAAALFVLHPLHTEAVAYISGRADMMSGALMFTGLALCISEARFPRRYVSWGAGLLCFVAALVSKESSMIFPVLLALLVFVPAVPPLGGASRGAYYRQRALPLAAAAVLLITYAILRATVLSFGADAGTEAQPFGARLLQTGQAFAFYIQKLFLPLHLHMEQTLEGVPAWTSAVGWLLLVAIIGIITITWRARHRNITLGLAWFTAAWLPISGLFPLNAPMAEHWMYVPMAGFWWAFCEGLWLLARQPALRPVLSMAVAALCLLHLGLTVNRNADWHTNESLFRATLAENPDSLRVQHNLGVTYEALLGNHAGARRHFEAVLANYQAQKRAQSVSGDTSYLLEDEIEVRMSLARLALSMGDYPDAADQYGVLVNGLAPEKFGSLAAEAAVGMGRSLLALGNYIEAANVLGRAVSIQPAREPEVRALLLEGVPPAPIS